MKNDYEKYAKALIRLRAKAFPFAMLRANNRLGKKMWVVWRQEYKRTMTLRNSWTINSIKLVLSKRPVIQGMRVVVGTRMKYLKDNEEGQTLKPKMGNKNMIDPSKLARRGGSYGAMVPRALKKREVGTTTGGNRKKKNAAQIRQAQKDKKKLAMIEGKNGKISFYKMRKKKGKKNSKGDFEKNGIRVWSLKSSQKLKKNNAMERAREKTMTHAPRYYKHELRREIQEVKRRSGL